MPASTDLLRLAIVPEAVVGQTPADPNYQEMRITSESLGFAYNSTNSNELGGTGRGVRDSILTGGAAAGDINFELHKDPAIEELFAGLLGSVWGADPLGIGLSGSNFVYVSNTMQTYTVEKRWQVATADYNYHRYHGLTPNTLQLTITPNNPITGTFGLLETSFEIDEGEDVGSNYTAAPSDPVMTAPLVTAINLFDTDDHRVLDIGTYCFTNLVVNVNNNDRGIACIGYLGNHETVFGKLECLITFSLLYANDFVLQALQDQTDFKLVVEVRDAPGNTYVLTFPRVRFATSTVVAGGTGQDVVVTGTMNALVGEAPNQYSLMIERGVPGPLTANSIVLGEGIGATITFGGGPADDIYTATVTLTLTGTTAAPVVVPLDEADDRYEAASKVAEALSDALGANMLVTVVREVITLGLAGTTTAIGSVTVAIA